MGLSKLASQKIFLDTAPLIYFIEGNSSYQSKLNGFFNAFDRRDFAIVTSTITLLEVLVQPLRVNRLDLVERYSQFLSEASGMELVELNSSVAVKAAELRARYNLKTPDAIQVAAAIQAGATYFLTNDIRLKNMDEVTIITPNNL